MMITTIERPDANALRRAVMQAPWWYSSMKLPAVLDLIEQLDAKGHVDQLWTEAPLGEHLGGGFRLYAQLPSITSFTRDIRAIATHQYLTCVDLKNCYPTILMHMYPDILSLKYYVDHRDEVLAKTMRHYDVSRDAAKQLYLRLSFKGTRNKWRSDWAPDVADHDDFVIDFENAINSARNRIIRDNSEMYKKIIEWIDPKTGKPKPNPDRTLMGYVLQKKERDCIDAMRAIDGYKTVAILHDELMIEKVEVDQTEELIRVMNEAVATVVPGMVCEIKEPELPLWFVPEKLCWFETLRLYNPIDMANHRDGLETWLPIKVTYDHAGPSPMQDEGDSDEGQCPSTGSEDQGGGGAALSPQADLEDLVSRVFVPRKPWELGIQMFSGKDMRAHLTRKKKEDSRIDERLHIEIKHLQNTASQIDTKVQVWFFRHFFAIVDKERGSIVEVSENGLFVMSQLQFKQKHGNYGKISLRSMVKPGKTLDDLIDMRHVAAIDYYPANAPPNIINTFTGLGVEPMNLNVVPPILRGELELEVIAGVNWANSHLKNIIANGHEPSYIFIRNTIAHILQCRGKLRTFLQIYSKEQQCGKGIFFDNFLGSILGANFYKPTSGLSDDEGLLGKFNWLHHSKMLILLDENGEFMFDRRGHAKLRTWLSSNRVTFTQKGCMGVEMNDFACLIALTNEIMSIRVEARGDARSVPIAINEGYSLASAEAGSIVDGAPMTIDRRKQYFRDGAKYLLSPEIGTFVQRAFLGEMLQVDLSEYDFQSNIPNNDLRASLAYVADEDSYLDEFVEAWSNNELYYTYRDQDVMLVPNEYNSLCTTPKWHKFRDVWLAFVAWSSNTHSDVHNCRNDKQLALKLIKRNLVGEKGETSNDMHLWRKVGTGNLAMYCCNKRATGPSHASRELD